MVAFQRITILYFTLFLVHLTAVSFIFIYEAEDSTIERRGILCITVPPV